MSSSLSFTPSSARKRFKRAAKAVEVLAEINCPPPKKNNNVAIINRIN